MVEYIGIIHKDKNSEFGVCFPDFPGCVSAGKSLEEARVMAKEALEFHIEGMREDGETIPRPSTLDMVKEHEFYKDAEAVIIIDAKVQAKSQRINVYIDDDLLAEIDSVASNRSAFLSEAARERLKHVER